MSLTRLSVSYTPKERRKREITKISRQSHQKILSLLELGAASYSAQFAILVVTSITFDVAFLESITSLSPLLLLEYLGWIEEGRLDGEYGSGSVALDCKQQSMSYPGRLSTKL